jgi:hypothetical protein
VNWSDEKYVKLYVRDSLTWRAWPWQAKALWPLILRKLDGAGLLETGNLDPADAVSLQTDIPAEVVRPGLAAIITSGALKSVAGGLVAPSFVDAQEARKTEAQKKRDQRERVRDQRIQAQVTEIRAAPVPIMSPAVPTASPDVPRCPPPAQPVPSPAQPVPSPEKLAGAFALAPPRPAKVKAPKEPTDPRHAPLVKALCDAFSEVRQGTYPFGARDAAAVRDLLSKGSPEVIVAAWTQALRSRSFPLVSTLPELERSLAHFVGATPPTATNTRSPQPPSDWTHIEVGEVTL